VALPTALSILDEIERDEARFKLISSGREESLGVVQYMLMFIYNSCIITVGARVFGYIG
jgi:hypothetical protein